MKQLRFALFVILTLMTAVITFFSFNLIFTVVANHQALDKVSLSGIPMVAFSFILLVFMVGYYYYQIKKRRDVYFFRYYSVVIGIPALIGVVFSILCGTFIYGSFVKDYVFRCYPLILLIIHSILLIVSVYTFIFTSIKIKKEKPERVWIGSFAYTLRTIGLSELLMFALERLGAFLLIPYFYSDIDGAYTIPYLIQLLIPTFILVTYIIHEDFLRNRKVTLILSLIGLGYSLFSLIYMIAMSKNTYPLMINSITPIQQFERLVCYPIDAILLYGVSILITSLNAFNNTVMSIKEKKSLKNKRS